MIDVEKKNWTKFVRILQILIVNLFFFIVFRCPTFITELKKNNYKWLKYYEKNRVHYSF